MSFTHTHTGRETGIKSNYTHIQYSFYYEWCIQIQWNVIELLWSPRNPFLQKPLLLVYVFKGNIWNASCKLYFLYLSKVCKRGIFLCATPNYFTYLTFKWNNRVDDNLSEKKKVLSSSTRRITCTEYLYKYST